MRVGVISHYISKMIEHGTHTYTFAIMAQDGEEYHTDSDGVDLNPDTPPVCDILQATPVQSDPNPVDDEEPEPQRKPVKATRKRQRDDTETDACAKIRCKLAAGGPSSMPNGVPRGKAKKQTTISQRPF